MSQKSAHLLLRVCRECQYDEITETVNCPRCGRPMQIPQQIRILGGLQIFLGLILTIAMAFIINGIYQMIANDGKAGYSKITSPEKIKVGLIIVQGVLVIGIVTIINGVWHTVTGRRNMFLLWILFGLAFVLITAAQIIPAIFP